MIATSFTPNALKISVCHDSCVIPVILAGRTMMSSIDKEEQPFEWNFLYPCTENGRKLCVVYGNSTVHVWLKMSESMLIYRHTVANPIRKTDPWCFFQHIYAQNRCHQNIKCCFHFKQVINFQVILNSNFELQIVAILTSSSSLQDNGVEKPANVKKVSRWHRPSIINVPWKNYYGICYQFIPNPTWDKSSKIPT